MKEFFRILAAYVWDRGEYNAPVLLRTTLRRIVEEEGEQRPTIPFEFFDMSGEGSGISVSGLGTWPFNSSYCVCMWVRRSPHRRAHFGQMNALSPRHSTSRRQTRKSTHRRSSTPEANLYTDIGGLAPRLFSFLTAEGKGVDCFLQGSKLVISVIEEQRASEKNQTVEVEDVIPEGKWVQLIVQHTKPAIFSVFGKSEIQVWINGVEKLKTFLPFPTRSSKPLTDCWIGCHWDGQIGPVFVISESLSGSPLRALLSMGEPSAGARIASCDVIEQRLIESDPNIRSKVSIDAFSFIV